MANPSTALVLAYQKVFHLAQNAKDQKTLDVLNSNGKPRYDTAKNLGQIMRIIKKYQK